MNARFIIIRGIRPRIRRRCASPNTIMWSRHSRRIVPISLSTYEFCHGDPKSWLEAENAALRQQLIVLQRQVRGRVQFTNSDRLFFIQLYRWFPSVLKAMTIMRPETVMRWQRAGFRRYWRWKSRSLGGRPKIAADPVGPTRACLD